MVLFRAFSYIMPSLFLRWLCTNVPLSILRIGGKLWSGASKKVRLIDPVVVCHGIAPEMSGSILTSVHQMNAGHGLPAKVREDMAFFVSKDAIIKRTGSFILWNMSQFHWLGQRTITQKLTYYTNVIIHLVAIQIIFMQEIFGTICVTKLSVAGSIAEVLKEKDRKHVL